jgi:PIN domain nuclease of toxin-antitoxin system
VESGVVYLDTHAVIWLYDGDLSWLSKHAQRAIETGDIRISPMVMLELQYLREVHRLKMPPDHLLSELNKVIEVDVCSIPFPRLITAAASETWTRDPFDRIITAHARLADAALITADEDILKAYKKALT